jgi:hypothetical protein
MAYGSRGRRPVERASKSSHHHVINDEAVASLVRDSWLPQVGEPHALPDLDYRPDFSNDIQLDHFIAIDGSYQEVSVRPEYPSASLCFMQFGAVAFSKEDLLSIDRSPHPSPEDMEKLRSLERLKLAFPLKNMRLSGAGNLTDSIRKTIYEFFCNSVLSGSPLIETLRWLVFREFDPTSPESGSWHLASNPCTQERGGLGLSLHQMREDFSFACPETQSRIYLTDIFRLHEQIDEQVGAGGILGYLMTTIEQIIAAHVMRLILRRRPAALAKIAIIKDGPLAFFGVTANLHRPMRDLLNYISRTVEPVMLGVEKSGPFADHAHQIRHLLGPGQAVILDDDYIYRNILAGSASEDAGRSYGASTYYGRKVIFKSRSNAVYVLTVPTKRETATPAFASFHSLEKALQAADLLHCDMYDDALLPVALANKLVSLSAHPSQRILERFASHSVGGAR